MDTDRKIPETLEETWRILEAQVPQGLEEFGRYAFYMGALCSFHLVIDPKLKDPDAAEKRIKNVDAELQRFSVEATGRIEKIFRDMEKH